MVSPCEKEKDIVKVELQLLLVLIDGTKHKTQLRQSTVIQHRHLGSLSAMSPGVALPMLRGSIKCSPIAGCNSLKMQQNVGHILQVQKLPRKGKLMCFSASFARVPFLFP